MTLARKLFALKAVPSETYHEAINEAGAIHALLSIGKDPNEFEPGTHRSILVNLAEGGIDVDTLALLLEFGADPNIRNSDGESALHAVRGPSSAEFAETLLRFGANPNLRDKRGATPLIAAVRTQNISLARVLLTAGSDPEAQDSNGLSAIDYARKIIDIDSRFFEIFSLVGHEKSSARHARSTSIVSPTRRETQGEPDSEKAPRVSPMP